MELLMSNHSYAAIAPQTFAMNSFNFDETELSTKRFVSVEKESIHSLFHQLTQALTVLSSAAELTLPQDQSHPSQTNIRVWLQPSARRAEDALHQLRELQLPASSAVTELTQSLTVLVLAADMLAQGQLTGEVMPESYDLMRRNAERAMACILALRVELA
jgi:hypothetical protein